MAKKSASDPALGVLLASPRPDRRAALKRIEAVRAPISAFVRKIEVGLAVTGALLGEAIDACEAEGFNPGRASALVAEE